MHDTTEKEPLEVLDPQRVVAHEIRPGYADELGLGPLGEHQNALARWPRQSVFSQDRM